MNASRLDCGGIAQLVERLHGMQKVRSSNLLTSTKTIDPRLMAEGLFFSSPTGTFDGMRVVIQRVTQASVAIAGIEHARIGHGLLVLVAAEAVDGEDDVKWLCGKLARLRIFADDQGKMNRSIGEVVGEVLVVSQFTLFASTMEGNRPSFLRAARPHQAIPLYEAFVARLSADLGKSVQTGVFAADMQVSLVNDGPVTISMDSRDRQ